MQNTTFSTFGNLTSEPVTRTTKKNVPYIVFNVAYNPTKGERKFVKCFVWSKTQQRFAAKLRKGERVKVSGPTTERETQNSGSILMMNTKFFNKQDHNKAATSAA